MTRSKSGAARTHVVLVHPVDVLAEARGCAPRQQVQHVLLVAVEVVLQELALETEGLGDARLVAHRASIVLIDRVDERETTHLETQEHELLHIPDVLKRLIGESSEQWKQEMSVLTSECTHIG